VLAERISQSGTGEVYYAASFDQAVRLACELAQPGDMILTLGAGNVSQLGALVLARLETQALAKATA
jgi:UDP-N-acetylmuramate--alanine ligase